MTKNDNSWVNTGYSIRDFGSVNVSIINALVNGASNLNIVNTILIQIQVENETQKMVKTGYTKAMKGMRSKLLTEAKDTLRKLITFAKFTKNVILLEEMKNARRELSNCTKCDLQGFAQLIYDRAQANIAALPPYNITTATQASLLAAITPYNATLGKTGIGRSETKQSTQRMQQLIATLITAIRGLDDAVETVRSTKVDFYNGYRAARKVIRYGGQKSMLKCVVTDEEGNVLEGVLVMLYLLGADGQPLKTKGNVFKKRTGEKGGFLLSNVPDGNYLVEFAKLEYEGHHLNVTLKRGERVDLKVVMKKKVLL